MCEEFDICIEVIVNNKEKLNKAIELIKKTLFNSNSLSPLDREKLFNTIQSLENLRDKQI